ncbi:aminoacyl-tRNA hydrolase [Bacillus sp. CECT 9360]|uniref:aminoacyl-tRNA hydrolase n=1 Tax=Bacillus sp. CECT 9360 TaxID=2845821 RepID=UPI001E516CA7|nr:aminoacyl-tRNA hydrolase [Bacillus sp. CECT 9360]CAH0347581.1 Peptidyl-tRNA hydrolase [Bacillus sp. CECT 9360]
MKIFVGLGNPGKQYEHTRHNIGFDVIDELSKKWAIPLDQAKHKGIYGIGSVNGEKILLLKPLTYMNLSGESIAAVMNFFKAELEDIVVLYDDLDLPVGRIRLRQKGSAGGHNGIKSTIAHLGTQEFNRIRIGIGRPIGRIPVIDYVLGRFMKEDWETMSKVIEKCAEACEDWTKKPFLQVMNEHNQ